MFFMGGFLGGVPKYYGPAERRACSVCGREGDFLLMKLQSSLLIFFMPLPVRTEYDLVCPFCGARTAVTREEFRRLLTRCGGSE